MDEHKAGLHRMTSDASSEQGFSCKQMLPAVVFAMLSLGVGFTLTMAPPARGEIAVVFPPTTDEVTAWSLVREAGGLIVGPTRFSNIVVAYAPNENFQHRARQLGALFFTAARGLCAPDISSEET